MPGDASDIRREAAAIIDRVLVACGAQPLGDLPHGSVPGPPGCTIQVALNIIQSARPEPKLRRGAGIYGMLKDLQNNGDITKDERFTLEVAASLYDQEAYLDLYVPYFD